MSVKPHIVRAAEPHHSLQKDKGSTGPDKSGEESNHAIISTASALENSEAAQESCFTVAPSSSSYLEPLPGIPTIPALPPLPAPPLPVPRLTGTLGARALHGGQLRPEEVQRLRGYLEQVLQHALIRALGGGGGGGGGGRDWDSKQHVFAESCHDYPNLTAATPETASASTSASASASKMRMGEWDSPAAAARAAEEAHVALFGTAGGGPQQQHQHQHQGSNELSHYSSHYPSHDSLRLPQGRPPHSSDDADLQLTSGGIRRVGGVVDSPFQAEQGTAAAGAGAGVISRRKKKSKNKFQIILLVSNDWRNILHPFTIIVISFIHTYIYFASIHPVYVL